MQQRADDKTGARASYEEALNIRRRLAADYPFLSVYREGVSSTLGKIGELDLNSGDAQRALQIYREKLAVDQELRQSFSSGLSHSVNLSSDLEKIAGLQLRLGDEEGARRSDEERLAVDHKISIGFIELGDMLLRSDDQDEAEASYKYAFQFGTKALYVAQRNYSKEPNESTKNAFVDAAGTVSLAALLAHQPLVAKQFAEEALNLDSSQIAIDINRAHAYLLLGRSDEAKAIYLARKDAPKSRDGSQTYASNISDRFDTFRRLRIDPPDLDRMAKEIGLKSTGSDHGQR